MIGGYRYNMGYDLTYVVEHDWAVVVKTIPSTWLPKHSVFTQPQEGAKKDVVRVIGVVQLA